MASHSPVNTAAAMSAPSSAGGSVSPRQAAAPKNVAFELLFMDSPQYRARLPMRVQIYPHDATESIVTTVKNFYGLYSGPAGSKGVCFEDEHGNTLIARYENFTNNMIVYVRVIDEAPVVSEAYAATSFHTSAPGVESYHHDAYQGRDGIDRSPRRHNRSPMAEGDVVQPAGSAPLSHASLSKAFAQHDGYADSLNGYASEGSASCKSKDQLGTTDISVDNIVEGGRRKRAKFESSELPLFAPPQMPAATSNPSVSPARRIDQHRAPVGFGHSSHHPFANPRPIHTSQYYNNNGIYATPTSEDRRHRASMSYGSGNGAILPTPDPTVGSCMSEEDKDVAIQLMRLGDMSHMSHGRTSASTLDDTFSGKADAASSTGATSDGESDSEDELPPARRQKVDASGASRSVYPTTESNFMMAPAKTEYSSEEEYSDAPSKVQTVPIPKPKPVSASKPKTKATKPSVSKPKKTVAAPGAPMSPASATPSHKESLAAAGLPGQAGEDDQPDLSSKPRCQRCRKSKKGCDRQRPCGRCRDAGLSADQCISEDEGNGRKGRYGRHMGVPIKKEEVPVIAQPALLPAAPIAPIMNMAMTADKSKKRKR